MNMRVSKYNWSNVVAALGLAVASYGQAAPNDVIYQARVTDTAGKPLTGPVDVTFKFFHQGSGGTAALVKDVDDVVLAQGVFSVALPLDSAERDLVFGHAAGAWIEVTAGGRTYPRQAFNAVPYALNVGVQRELQLRADDYVLTLKGNPAASGDIDLVLPADDGVNGQVLKTDGAGNLYWDAPPAAGAGMQGANNLSELTDPAAARAALALGNAATRAVGTGAGDVAAGNHGHADATGATAGFMAAVDKTKLDGIEAGADVTDATNVAAAGAVMNGYFGSNGIMLRTGPGSYSVLADNSANWNAAHTSINTNATNWSAAYTAVTTNDGISGNRIDGGIISNFASTGIDDNADAVAMTIDANERVGIGTATPVDLLEVRKDQNTFSGIYARNMVAAGNTSAYAGYSANVSGTGGGLFAFPADFSSGYRQDRVSLSANSDATGVNIEAVGPAQTIRMYAGDVTPRLTILADGKVGIGSSAPTTALDVGNATLAASYARVPNKVVQIGSTTNDDEVAYSLFAQDSANNRRSKFFLDDAAGITGIDFSYSAGPLDFQIQRIGSPVVTVKGDGTGNVGIGTISPTTNLQVVRDQNAATGVVVSNSDAGATAKSIITASSSGATASLVVYSAAAAAPFGGNALLTSDTGDDLLLGTDNAARLTIKSSTGNVGIGTTNPTAKLHVGGTVGIDGIRFPDGSLQTTAAAPTVTVPLRFSRTSVAHNATDAAKDAVCTADFGASYVAGSGLDLLYYFGPKYNASTALAFNLRGAAVSYRITTGAIIQPLGADASYPVPCVRTTAFVRASHSTVAHSASAATKDGVCSTDFGASYAAATNLDVTGGSTSYIVFDNGGAYFPFNLRDVSASSYFHSQTGLVSYAGVTARVYCLRID